MSVERQVHEATTIQSHNHSMNKNSHFLRCEFYTLNANHLNVSYISQNKGQKRVMDSKSQVTFLEHTNCLTLLDRCIGALVIHKKEQQQKK